MPVKNLIKIGKRGTLVVPLPLRKRFGLEEGDIVITEEQQEGILIRPAIALPKEHYTKERKAEFLLSNATDKEDYKRAVRKVRKMGIDPDKISHYKVTGT